jgi:hypothetical protein
MSLVRLALDTGFATQEAYAFVRRLRDARLMAVKGVARGAALVGTPTAVDATTGGKKLRRGIKVYSVAVGIAKLEFYNNLRVSDATEPDLDGGVSLLCRQILDAVFKRDIESIILEAFKARVGRSTSRREVRSWKESLFAMAKVLNDPSIPDSCGVGVEYGIPQSSKRIDLLLSGRDETGRGNLMIVELKQWESARRTDVDGLVRTRFAEGEANTSHPSYQSWSYASAAAQLQ